MPRSDSERLYLICDFVNVVKGQKVLARDEEDELYYEAKIKERVDSQWAVVQFERRDVDNFLETRGRRSRRQQNTKTRFIIPRYEEGLDDDLEEGDFVLAKTEIRGKKDCYIPGTVALRTRKTPIDENTFAVHAMDNSHLLLRREHLLKINPDRSPFILHLKKKSGSKHNRPKKGDVVDRHHSPLQHEKHTSTPGTVITATVARKTKKRGPDVKAEDIKELSDRLNGVQQQIAGMSGENSDLKKIAQENSDDLQKLISELQELNSRQPPKPEPFQQEEPSPEPSIIPKTPTPPPSPLLIPEKTLYRSYDDGWFYNDQFSGFTANIPEFSLKSGLLLHKRENEKVLVEDNQKFIQPTAFDDIVPTDQNQQDAIQVGDSAIIHRFDYPNSYAPAKILQCCQDDVYTAQFYDDVIANVTKDQIYRINSDKYDQYVKYIEDCLNRWIGKRVVARSDNDGRYHFALCKDRVGKGQNFHIQWEDGSHSVQMLSCIFGEYSRHRKLEPGHYAIAITPAQKSFLPARVLSNDGTTLSVCYCDGSRSSDVNVNDSFWTSQVYYELAVGFYRNQQTLVL